MASVQNPFTTSLLTFDPARFYGRENEITSILRVITASEPSSHAIYGLRTIGKTSLLKYLKDVNGALQRYRDAVNVAFRPGGGQRILFVYLNLRHFHEGNTLFNVMCGRLQDELAVDPLVDDIHVPGFEDTPTRRDRARALRTALHQLENHGVRVVFLLDDFDIALDYLDPNDDRLLRTLSDYAVLIIATEEPISELRPDLGASSPLLGILRPEAIGPLSEAAARLLITEPLQAAGVTLTDEEQDFLLATAGRQPFLLTAACELYYDLRLEYPDLVDMFSELDTRKNLEQQFLARLAGLPHVNNVLNRVWNRLEPEEHVILYHISDPARTDLLGEGRSIIARLANKSLIYQDIKHSAYRLFSALFADFVYQRYSTRADTQTVPQQTDPIVENLSPIDRAVYEYLREHTDEVCTFEELLNSVWHDSEVKSKRALEAAVHRLRRELSEGDEIRNIRGRGYKYIPGGSAGGYVE